ncbi:hypothetical protein K2X30_05135 [bacterium]|jgi:hypothetical protein|nr:hypothetical protein [bacterium]
MRWNCPHCGVALAVADEKLGNGWTFSRCYKCAGFALLRRPEANLIKVDKAPPDGNFLLPESTETPMMSKPANDRLNQLAAQTAARKAAVTPAPAAMAPMAMPTALPPLPAPLPEMSAPKQRHSMGLRMLPIAIGFTMAMTVGSGAYLFMQGQAVWQKAREIREMGSGVAQNGGDEQTVTAAAPLREYPPERSAAIEPRNVPTPPTPSATHTAATHALTSLIVEIKAPTAKLRSGPGLNFAVQGMVKENLRLSVNGFKDRWFQVIVPTEVLAAENEPAAVEVKAPQTQLAKREAAQAKPQLMWIRNDLVRLVQPTEADL